MTDIWACSQCHSINRQRNSTCYKCGARQEQASGEIADVRTEQAILSRATVPYRRSILRALVAAAFILAYAALSVIVLFESLALSQYVRDQIPALLQGEIDEAELVRLASPAVVPALLASISAIGALLFFAAWLSRVVMNLPALGGGMPNTTPTKAFIYPLIPIWNLFKTPPIIQNALYRLDPKAGGFFMILLAWIGLVGSAIIGFFAEWWANLRIATVATRSQTLGDAIAVVQGAFDTLLLVDIVTTLMAAFGAIILVMIIFRIESRAAARDGEIRKAAFAPRPEPGSADARPVGAGSAGGAVASAGAQATSMTTPTPAPAMVPGPFGYEPAVASSDDFEDRPVGSTGLEGPVARPLGAAPTGPQLHLRVEDSGSMIATYEGASEPITLDELPATAAALARAEGSAVLSTSSRSIEGGSPAERAMQVLARAGVPTRMEA